MPRWQPVLALERLGPPVLVPVRSAQRLEELALALVEPTLGRGFQHVRREQLRYLVIRRPEPEPAVQVPALLLRQVAVAPSRTHSLK